MIDNLKQKPSRLVFGIWIACAVAVVLLLALLSPREQPRPVAAPETENATSPAAEYREDVAPEQVPQDLARLIRRVDYALLQALMLTGYGPDSLELKAVDIKRQEGGAYPFQVLEIRLDSDPKRFMDELAHGLDTWAPEATIAPDSESSWTITSLDRLTHQIFVFGEQAEVTQGAEAGKMAVVIDDLGRDLGFARQLASLNYPVTFSILPGAAKSSQTAEMAVSSGHEVMLHQPMEPEGYPEVDPGPGALLTSMDEAAIRSQLDKNLAVISMARGINNHTGSRFTQIDSLLEPVMDELYKRKLFFLDSLTTPKSVASSVAKKHGLAYYRRSIFLDNVRETGAILKQLAKAERMARRSGQAIAIGHPYPETLAALTAWQQDRGTDVQVVSVSELAPIHRP